MTTKLIGRITEFTPEGTGGTGVVRAEGTPLETIVTAAMLRSAGIAPRVGTRVAFVLGEVGGLTQATALEPL